MSAARCQACGAPATQMTRDVRRIDTGKGYWEFAPHGQMRLGCDRHPPAPPRMYEDDGTPAGRLTDDEGRAIPF